MALCAARGARECVSHRPSAGRRGVWLSYPLRDPSFEYRLVLLEYELHYTDDDPAVKVSDLPVFNPENRPLGTRLVYLATIPLKP
jgi:hypothetical protein